jgi:hypothetical protein
MPVFDPLVAEYRYFVADFLTNEVIAELPIKGVNYERALKGAGSFSGSIPVITKTNAYNLYENTMPGKTALYVVRNDECVWGGLIWSRSYSVQNRELSISASEFTSYFHHRYIWKTYTNDYEATVSAASNVCTVAITNGSFNFATGMPVRLVFAGANNFDYDSYGEIIALGVDPTKQFTVSVPGIANGSYTGVTACIRVDTFDYVRQLLDEMLIDFSSIDFPNDEIQPGAQYAELVTNKSLTNNVATLTIGSGHVLTPGQTIDVVTVDSTFNGTYEVTAVTDTTVSYAKTASNVAPTAVAGASIGITQRWTSIDSFTQTPPVGTGFLQTSGPVPFTAGQTVNISGVDDPAWESPSYNGSHVITRVYTDGPLALIGFPNPGEHGFVINIPATTPEDIATVSGTASQTPLVVYGTYGSYPANSDFGLEFATSSFVPVYPTSSEITAAGLPSNLYPVSGPLPAVAGNITLTARPIVPNSEGSVDTLLSIVFNDGSNEVVAPRIVGGEVISEARAKTYYLSTNQHLGKFASGSSANALAYAQNIDTIQSAWLNLITYEKSESQYGGVNVSTFNKILRGFELKSVGEELDSYSDVLNGFEYRVDCAYDTATASFSRTFVMIPVNFPDPPPPGEASPITRYGAQNLVFEYPGNISEVTLDESAEDAATRFFVTGNQGELGADASQPYSAAAATDFLLEGWPLLDQAEALGTGDIARVSPTSTVNPDSLYDEEVLYSYAKRYLAEFLPPVSDLKIIVNGSLQPQIGTYSPGDWCAVIINDDFVNLRLASNLEPRPDLLVRKIESIKVTVPDNPSFPEQVDLNLITEWEVDKRGE